MIDVQETSMVESTKGSDVTDRADEDDEMVRGDIDSHTQSSGEKGVVAVGEGDITRGDEVQELINERKTFKSKQEDAMSQREEVKECSVKEVCDGMPERREKLKSHPQYYYWGSQNSMRSGLKVGNKGRAGLAELFSEPCSS